MHLNNKTFIILLVTVFFVGGGVFFFMQSRQEENSFSGKSDPNSQQGDIFQDDVFKMEMSDENSREPTNDIDTSGTSLTSSEAYIDYSPSNFQSNSDKRRVLFFHAGWCPTCKAANAELNANLSDIPEDVVILRTDYDTEDELKDKYDITYQHTFVQVDSDGNEISKWNGGAVDELIRNIK